MSAAVGMLGKLGIDSANPVTQRFDFLSESLMCDEEFINANGLRGTLSHDISRVRAGIRRIHGSLSMQPNAVEMALLLPWILGTAGSGSPTVTFALADSLLTRNVAIDRNSGNLFTYSGVAVNRAVFHATQGQPLTVDLDLVGQDETISGSFPAISINTANGPYVFTDLVLSVNSVTATPKEFTLTIDNHIDVDRFLNSQTLTATNKMDRTVMFETHVPYGDFTALYNTGAGGVAAVATFTNAGAVLTMTIAKVALPRKSPVVPGRVEVMLPLLGQCFKSGANAELVVTQNPGP